MKSLRSYNKYDEYLDHQMEKTLDPARRKKWLGEEWDLKLDGFRSMFESHSDIIKPSMKALCVGARTGQEVVALNDMGLDAIGIDLVPCEPHVIKGDMHDMSFEDESFDFVFTNAFDHSLLPDKLILEMERVLKIDGHGIVQFNLQTKGDKYVENFIESVDHDVVSLLNRSLCIKSNVLSKNALSSKNHEIIFRKDRNFSRLYDKIGNVSEVSVPEKYNNIWNEINKDTQIKKCKTHNIQKIEIPEILEKLSKRAFYLVSIALEFNCKNIVEVGTSQGWQFYSFEEHLRDINGKIWSCDIKDVRNEKYKKKQSKLSKFVKGNSDILSSVLEEENEKIDLFYIDGSHTRGDVLRDVFNLKKFQSDNPIWVFDDFDVRFGCYQDIKLIEDLSDQYFVYYVGKTASNNPNHQLVISGKIN